MDTAPKFNRSPDSGKGGGSGSEELKNLSENLEKSIPQVSFSKDEKTDVQTFNFGRDNEGKIIIQGEKTKFEGWNIIKLLPDGITDLEKTYGKDIVKEALLRAYRNKTELAFEKFDQNIDKVCKEDLERATPEKVAKVKELITEFESLAPIFQNTLKEKSEELNAKGIYFNPDHIQNFGHKGEYGSYYKEYINLAVQDHYNELIKQAIDNPLIYPPLLNFDSLEEFIHKRIMSVQELTNDIKKLETEEDLNMFTMGNKEGKSYVHQPESGILKHLMNMLLAEDAIKGMERIQYNENYQNWENNIAENLMQFKSYEEALNYFNKKVEERESIKEKFIQSLETGIDANIKGQELTKEMMVQNFGGDINNIESKVSRIEKDRQDATELLSDLLVLETSLSGEDIIFDGSQITVLSAQKRLEQYKNDKEKEEENLKNLRREVSEKRNSKPGLFGNKNKWEKELSLLEQQEKELQEKVKGMTLNLQNNEFKKLYDATHKYIKPEEYSSKSIIIEEFKKKYKEKEGKPAEVFADLKAKLSELINKKFPESVVTLYKEYKELEKQLS